MWQSPKNWISIETKSYSLTLVWSSLLAGTVKPEGHETLMPVSRVLWQTALIFLSSYIFCGAGMVWNDWIDRDIDAGVARTKNRPLASKRITTATALLWGAFQGLVSYAILHHALEGKDMYVLSPPLQAFLPALSPLLT